MITVYIGSTSGYSGKSLVALGLALRLKEDGYRVGYMKPYGKVPVVEQGKLTDGDVLFMKNILGLAEPVEDLCPVVHSHDLLVETMKGKGKDFSGKVLKAYKSASKGKDVMILGGARDIYDGSVFGISGVSLTGELGAKVIIVDPFTGEICLDCLMAMKEIFGEGLIGAVINRVPPEGMKYLKDMASPFLKKKGIPLLGILPSDRVLNAVTIRQLNQTLGGTVLCCEERLDDLVENFSIGAMDVESAMKYFRRTPNKAVITGGHRSDIQLAALETSTRCLVLTGDLLPNALILGKAKASGVPVITVRHDTLTTVESIESMLGKARIREDKKVQRAIELMDRNFDYGTFYKSIGLKKK